jgi:hypothetical protein
VKVVWDRLLVEGPRAFIKTGLIIMGHFKQQILQVEEFRTCLSTQTKSSCYSKRGPNSFHFQNSTLTPSTKLFSSVERDLSWPGPSTASITSSKKCRTDCSAPRRRLKTSLAIPIGPSAPSLSNAIAEREKKLTYGSFGKDILPVWIRSTCLETRKTVSTRPQNLISTTSPSTNRLSLSVPTMKSSLD